LLAELEQHENQDFEMSKCLATSLKVVIYILKTWVPSQPRGIADLLFDLEDKQGSEWMKNDPEHAIGFLSSLFWAAHLTTRASTQGLFLCLANYPSVTKKLHDEIDHVLGDRRPTLEDKNNRPYTEATILESLRLISQVPMGAVRLTSEDVNIDRVTIPKDTLVLLNTWFYHHNEEIYEDPWTFKQERFLDDFGQILPQDHTLRK
ncbi:unnamed protein product, partial [Candidula unifasciata]